jgi:hypothetical protein
LGKRGTVFLLLFFLAGEFRVRSGSGFALLWGSYLTRQYPLANILGYHKTRMRRGLYGGGLLFLFLFFFLGTFLLALAFVYFRVV